ncbi:MAG: enoyl-CoA hydratase-related protein, partial [Candidatus Binatia bacterium]
VGTQTAPRILGEGRALAMILAGQTIDARRAHRIGLVGSVVPVSELRAAADRLARRLAAVDRRLAASVKDLVVRGLELPLEAALARERTIAGRTAR